MLGGCRYLRQRLRSAKRERGNSRDRPESLVSNIDEVEGMAREARDRE